MAHEIMGNSFVYRGQPAWHGIGVELPEEHRYNMREAFRCAGADYSVETFQLYDDTGNAAIVANFAQGIRRVDSGEPLGVVGPSFVPLQWEAMADAYQPLLDARKASVETVGVLKGGARLFALVKFEGLQLDVLAGDTVRAYGLIVHAHDGTLSVKLGPTAIRVVCNNTVQAALNSRSSQLVSIRHRNGVDAAVKDATSLIDHARGEFVRWGEFAKACAGRDLRPSELQAFIKATFPERFKFSDPAQAMLHRMGIPTAEEPSPSEEFVGRFMDLFEGGALGSSIPGIRGTLWQAFNAATELTQHGAKFRSDATRTDSILFGSAAETARKATKAARELLAA